MRVMEIQSGRGRYGAERHTAQLLKYYDRNDIRWVAVAEDAENHVFLELPNNHGEFVWGTFCYAKLVKYVRTAMRAVKVGEEVGVDVVHSHLREGDLLGWVVSRLLGTKWVVTAHGPFQPDRVPQSLAGRALSEIHKALVRRDADEVVAISNYVKNVVRDEVEVEDVRLHVIHNGTEIERFSTSDTFVPPKSCSDDACILVQVGIGRRKGTADVINALDMIARRTGKDRICALLLGESGHRQEYEGMIREAGLQDVVHLLGWRSDIPAVLNTSDILFYTGVDEGFGRNVTEAMMAGVPVVGYQNSAIPELVVDGECGYLVESGNVGALTERTVELICDQEKRIRFGKRAEVRAKRQFSAERFASDTAELLEKVS